MVVVGGRESGNTRRLAELAASTGIPALHVESEQELTASYFRKKSLVGLTAGASTPKRLIDAVECFLETLQPDGMPDGHAGMIRTMTRSGNRATPKRIARTTTIAKARI
jgi:4-hydroxy-3-methylbut-2-enyl diphosphate reductase IspH